MSSCLPMFKSYLKIIGLLYIQKHSNFLITPKIIEKVIKETHIFNDIVLASKPYIIKASPKSDMAIIWVDIWNLQNDTKTELIINWCFNIRRVIAIICRTNMNPGVSQCRNCWKWGYLTLSCWSHMSRCAKCNEPHNSKHYRKKVWCCKENNKLSPPKLATKEGKPCSYVFKCVNCKGNHQADNNTCPYWWDCFNRDQHGRKQQELCKSRVQ